MGGEKRGGFDNLKVLFPQSIMRFTFRQYETTSQQHIWRNQFQSFSNAGGGTIKSNICCVEKICIHCKYIMG